MSLRLGFDFDVRGGLCLRVDYRRPQLGVSRFLGSVCVYEAVWVPRRAEWFESEALGSLCLVWCVRIGVCIGGVAVYVLWVFLIKVEEDCGGCFPC